MVFAFNYISLLDETKEYIVEVKYNQLGLAAKRMSIKLESQLKSVVDEINLETIFLENFTEDYIHRDLS